MPDTSTLAAHVTDAGSAADTTAGTADPAVLRRRLQRAERRVQLLSEMIEDRASILYQAQLETERTNAFLLGVLEAMDSTVFVTDGSGRIMMVGGSAARLVGVSADELVGTVLDDLIAETRTGQQTEVLLRRADGVQVPVLLNVSATRTADGRMAMVWVAVDLTERNQLEFDLRQAQKLESVGQLAAGVAHEINTPIQFVADSVHFLGDTVRDLLELVEAHRDFVDRAVGADPTLADHADRLQRAADEVDLEFIAEEAPSALERTLGGIRQVSDIVAALKRFAHPGGDELGAVDLDEVVRTALTVSRSEWKYVAEVNEDLGGVPFVRGSAGELGQVVLNIVVNAAHAIDAARTAAATDQLGVITVRTTHPSADTVVLEITDTGCGIPDEVLERMFEPFFTTKEVGKGTGQGLAITHSVVVERHHGTIEVDTVVGLGSTFRITLPTAGSSHEVRAK